MSEVEREARYVAALKSVAGLDGSWSFHAEFFDDEEKVLGYSGYVDSAVVDYAREAMAIADKEITAGAAEAADRDKATREAVRRETLVEVAERIAGVSFGTAVLRDWLNGWSKAKGDVENEIRWMIEGKK